MLTLFCFPFVHPTLPVNILLLTRFVFVGLRIDGVLFFLAPQLAYPTEQDIVPFKEGVISCLPVHPKHPFFVGLSPREIILNVNQLTFTFRFNI